MDAGARVGCLGADVKLKTAILGSAAVFAVGAAAQAADLSVAEPVEYVRVCDGFGAGYWAIPGTDTCLKIGGYIQVDTAFYDSVDAWGYTSDNSANWELILDTSMQLSARSMTEYGELAAYVDLRFEGFLHSAWVELGGVLVGRADSLYDYGGGFTFGGSDLDSEVPSTYQARLSWARDGFGIAFGIEDPRDRFGSDLDADFSLPNFVAAITASRANWDGQLSAGFAETYYGSGFGIQAAATFKLDTIAPGDRLRLKAAWAQSEVASFADSDWWSWPGESALSALASFQHFWTSQWSSALTFSYAANPGYYSQYQVYGNLVWSPVPGFLAGAEIGYDDNSWPVEGSWTGKIRLKRSW